MHDLKEIIQNLFHMLKKISAHFSVFTASQKIFSQKMQQHLSYSWFI